MASFLIWGLFAFSSLTCVIHAFSSLTCVLHVFSSAAFVLRGFSSFARVLQGFSSYAWVLHVFSWGISPEGCADAQSHLERYIVSFTSRNPLIQRATAFRKYFGCVANVLC